jgi:membrane protein implicated in regulation of membrane protease activity
MKIGGIPALVVTFALSAAMTATGFLMLLKNGAWWHAVALAAAAVTAVYVIRYLVFRERKEQ